MTTDIWHYPRTTLAEQVLQLFEIGISSALIFFAPRRMGKTEFLRKDIEPLASDKGWQTFYFSFLDVGEKALEEFTKELASFTQKTDTIYSKTGRLLKRVKKISGQAAGVKAEIELNNPHAIDHNLKSLISRLATRNKILLLLDEVQILAQRSTNTQFIAALRTTLDIHKDNVKVIFTGSSREGLRRMFSQANAPFFHFGQNLPFPELGHGFTDHLSDIFKKVTGRKLNKEELWNNFQSMQKVPQLARALVERIALNPALTLAEAKEQLITEIIDDRTFIGSWQNCTTLEQLLLQEIAVGITALFSEETRNRLGSKLGINKLAVSSIQSSVRSLQRKGLIGRLPERGGYFIDDPNFESWLRQSRYE